MWTHLTCLPFVLGVTENIDEQNKDKNLEDEAKEKDDAKRRKAQKKTSSFNHFNTWLPVHMRKKRNTKIKHFWNYNIPFH